MISHHKLETQENDGVTQVQIQKPEHQRSHWRESQSKGIGKLMSQLMQSGRKQEGKIFSLLCLLFCSGS
jgi:hypothetical protein